MQAAARTRHYRSEDFTATSDQGRSDNRQDDEGAEQQQGEINQPQPQSQQSFNNNGNKTNNNGGGDGGGGNPLASDSEGTGPNGKQAVAAQCRGIVLPPSKIRKEFTTMLSHIAHPHRAIPKQ